MSVIIKGVQMPQSCSDCRLNYDQCACSVTGTGWYSDTMVLLGFNCDEERLQNCPLVELPEHHGRLIDADEMRNLWTGCSINGSILPLLDARPTVVEAE